MESEGDNDDSDGFDELFEQIARGPAIHLEQPLMMVTPNIRLQRLLGHGGMGSVWVAEHLMLETEVAVKFIAPAAQTSETALQRFRREARVAASIKGPHVVQVFDCGEMDNGVPYLVMERLVGETLGDRLRSSGPLTPLHTALLTSQVAGVLSAAHAAGIVHRDIKPDNLFLVATEYEVFIKVLDFGVAKKVPSVAESATLLTNSGALVGTPLYLSPEQIQTGKGDYTGDLWALATVAYEALAGSPPFVGETVGGVFMAIGKSEYEPMSAVRPDLPAEIDAWFARAFDMDVTKRFESAGGMATAFEAALGIEPMTAVGPPSRTLLSGEHSGALSASTTVVSTTSDAPRDTVTSTRAPERKSRVRALALVVASLGLLVAGSEVQAWIDKPPDSTMSAREPALETSLPAPVPPSADDGATNAPSNVGPSATPAPVASPSASSVHTAPQRSLPRDPPAKKRVPTTLPTKPRCDGEHAYFEEGGVMKVRPECRR